jgi:uncharacterized protein (TIGR03083 family)
MTRTPTTTSSGAYLEMARHQLEQLAELLDGLTDAEADQPSLCQGWRVRDVAAHVCSATEIHLTSVVAGVLSANLRPNAALRRWAIEHADQTTRAELVGHLRRAADQYGKTRRPGATRLAGSHELLVDYLVHQADMALTLHKPLQPEASLLRAALEAAPRIGGLMRCKQRMRGLTLFATDVDWMLDRKHEPAVHGPALSLLLAVTGRPVGIHELDGPGVQTLLTRCNGTP